MIKIFRFLFFMLILTAVSKNLLGNNSSSYLISQQAFKNYDFFTVLNKFKIENNKVDLQEYSKELFSATITENLILANEIAEKILSKDTLNQDAIMIYIVFNLKNNNLYDLDNFLLNYDLDQYELISFIFFHDDKFKNKKNISRTLLELVKSYYNSTTSLEINFNYLLFYSSLAILLDENNYEAIYLKAELYQLIQNYFVADTYYNKIPQKSFYYKDAQKNIAFNSLKYLKFKEAENKIKKILERNNDDKIIKKILADLYRINYNYNLAINYYTELIKLNDQDLWSLYYLRGICYERLDNWEMAEKDFLESLSINPDAPDVLNYLAYGWIEKNIFIERSLEMLKKAYEGNPSSYYILDSLAWAYYKKNNLKKAADLMEKVIDMAPGESISLDHLGDIYFAMNRKREAIYFWNQAIDLADSDDDLIKKINKKLEKYNAG